MKNCGVFCFIRSRPTAALSLAVPAAAPLTTPDCLHGLVFPLALRIQQIDTLLPVESQHSANYGHY